MAQEDEEETQERHMGDMPCVSFLVTPEMGASHMWA